MIRKLSGTARLFIAGVCLLLPAGPALVAQDASAGDAAFAGTVCIGGSLGLPGLVNAQAVFQTDHAYFGVSVPALALLFASDEDGDGTSELPEGLWAVQLNAGPCANWGWGFFGIAAVGGLGSNVTSGGAVEPWGYLGGALDLRLWVLWAEAGVAWGWFPDGQGMIPLVQLGVVIPLEAESL